MDDLIKRLEALEAFLRGAEPLRGANFGEPNPALHKGMFWWRNYLGPMAEAAAALADAQATIARLEVRDPTQDGYVKVIDVEKLLCDKLGIPWSATGISIVSLIDRLAALSPREGER